jgi:hypothetical protein
MPLPYVLASSALPDNTPSLPAVDPSLGQPRPRPVDGGKVPPLPPSQLTEMHASRPLLMSPSMPERVRRNRDTAEPSPRPTLATEPPLMGSFSHHCPSSSPRPCCFPVPIKPPHRRPEAAHHHRYRSQPFPLLLSLENIRSAANPSRRVREVSGRRWSRRSYEVEESSHCHSASSLPSSASPTSSPPSSSFPCQCRWAL